MHRKRRIIIGVICFVVLTFAGAVFVQNLPERSKFIRAEGGIESAGRIYSTIDSPFEAYMAVDAWDIFMQPDHYGYPTRKHYLDKLNETRSQSVAKIIQGLEDFSGETYGDDLDRWKQWIFEQNYEFMTDFTKRNDQ